MAFYLEAGEPLSQKESLKKNLPLSRQTAEKQMLTDLCKEGDL